MSRVCCFTKRSMTTAMAGLTAIALAMAGGSTARAASKDLGNGFSDLGVAAPISNHRGTVTTVDGDGRNIILSWIMDSRGGYALLMIDAETGKTEQFAIPFNNVKADSPYASILSSANKFYTHFGDYFVEFDPAKRAFTFSSKATPQMAMGMTEDDNGVIWSVVYPQSGVVSFNPKTKEFKDFGNVYKQDWPQYQRFVAADDAGWIYFGLGMTATQIVALDPATSQAKPLLKEEERHHGNTAYVYRNKDGKVYGQANHEKNDPWYELYKGEVRKIGDHAENPKPIVTSHQALFDAVFPDGKVLTDLNLVDRNIVISDPKTSEAKKLPITYTSEGAVIMALAAAADGTISGGTAFPMRSFSYTPEKDELINRPAFGQWNTVTAAPGDKFFVGGYPGGFMLEWDPKQPWQNTETSNSKSNPLFLTKVSPVIHRPFSLVALKDGSQVVMGGTPEYGHTGGGLLFWDRSAKKHTLITDQDVVPDQSTKALMELPGNMLLGGTTTEAGTGGLKKATLAELYMLDAATKKLTWHEAVLPGVKEYTALADGPNGLVYGFADRKTFFVFDPASKKIVKSEDLSATAGPSISPQGPRVFVPAGDRLFVLLQKGIGEIDQKTHTVRLVAESPVELEAGGDFKDGKIYFSKGSHVYSWQVK